MSHILRELCRPYGVTVNGPAVVAVPPEVAMAILPVIAPSGTVAVTFEVKFAVKPVALTPPNVTCVAPFKPPPVMTTEVPTFPLVGVKLVMLGRTMKLFSLFKTPVGVVTLTTPPVAVVVGMVAVK
jgi:hypothetical protein